MPLLLGLLALAPATLPQDGDDPSSVEQVSSSEGVWTPWDRLDDIPPRQIWWAENIPPQTWRFTYRYTATSFDGVRDGRDDLSSKNLFKRGFLEAPEEMVWQEHTFELAYGMREFTTLFARLPYLVKDLDGRAQGGADLDQTSEGIGDFVLGLTHYCCSDDDNGRLMLHLAVSAPTGSTDEEGDDPSGGDQKLPYPMQLGIGMWGVLPGAYWIKNQENWTWGVGGRGRLSAGRNDEGYRPGNTLTMNAWMSRELTSGLVGTLRLQNHSWGDYHGEDDELDSDTDPLNDEHRQGGARTELFAGAAWELGTRGATNRLELEVGVPVDEWLDGPQMSAEWILGFGWHFSF